MCSPLRLPSYCIGFITVNSSATFQLYSKSFIETLGAKLQEVDSNRRSQGYEPCEIPLLYPALCGFSAYLYRQSTSRLFLTSRTASSYLVFGRDNGRRWSRTIRAIIATGLQPVPLPLRYILPEPRSLG